MLRKNEFSKRIAPLIVFVAILLGLATFGTVSALALLRTGVSQLAVLLTANSLTGALAAFAYLQHREYEAQRLRTIDENLQIIRDMNQEARNVLGIVAFYGKQTKNDHVLKVFENGFRRMDFIMREVLSRAPFESQSQVPPPDKPVCLPFRVWGELRRRLTRSGNDVRAIAS